MKTQLVTSPGRHDHPPQPVRALATPPTRRVGLLDQAALHLGLALIRWGRRRPVQAELRERYALYAQTDEARREMEQMRTECQAMSLTLFR